MNRNQKTFISIFLSIIIFCVLFINYIFSFSYNSVVKLENTVNNNIDKYYQQLDRHFDDNEKPSLHNEFDEDLSVDVIVDTDVNVIDKVEINSQSKNKVSTFSNFSKSSSISFFESDILAIDNYFAPSSIQNIFSDYVISKQLVFLKFYYTVGTQHIDFLLYDKKSIGELKYHSDDNSRAISLAYPISEKYTFTLYSGSYLLENATFINPRLSFYLHENSIFEFSVSIPTEKESRVTGGFFTIKSTF